jgi:hypothetical protein
MTPDQALKHAWIHEPRKLKTWSKPRTLSKSRFFSPSETSKDKDEGNHYSSKSKKGTALNQPVPIVLGVRCMVGTYIPISLNSTLDSSVLATPLLLLLILGISLFWESWFYRNSFLLLVLTISHFSSIFNSLSPPFFFF